MHIYLVKRSDDWSYDDYDSFVCIAESEHAAQLFHPSGDYRWTGEHWESPSGYKPFGGGGWTAPSNTTVELIGTTDSNERRIILASFNAG